MAEFSTVSRRNITLVLSTSSSQLLPWALWHVPQYISPSVLRGKIIVPSLRLGRVTFSDGFTATGCLWRSASKAKRESLT